MRSTGRRCSEGSKMTQDATLFERISLWWWRRGLHLECIEEQTRLWQGVEAPLGACTRCYPRMKKIRKFYEPVGKLPVAKVKR